MNVYLPVLQPSKESVHRLRALPGLAGARCDPVRQTFEIREAGGLAHGDTGSGENHQLPVSQGVQQRIGEIDFCNLHFLTLERHGIFSCNRRGAEFHEVALSGESRANTRLPWASASLTQCLGLAAPFCVSDEQAVGEGGHVGVALGGDSCGGAADGVVK